MEHLAASNDVVHPDACPWCGRTRIRGMMPSPDGNRWYRCVSCTTTFFIRVMPKRRAAAAADDVRPRGMRV
jgi:transposase-like protein